MSSEADFVVILFPSTSYAIRGEKVLNQARIKSKLIPVPRQISSDCGVCLRVVQTDTEVAIQALTDARVDIDGTHDL